VHGELGCANVDRLDTSLRCHHWADGGAAEIVVAHDEFLDGHASPLGENLEYGGADRVSHVALVCVDLEDDTFLELWLVIAVVLLRVVGVHGVSHIS